MDPLKEKLVELLFQKLHAREAEFTDQLKTLKEALLSDTKSTAGDKHETGRAMTHLEQEKLSKGLQQLRKQQHLLQRINFNAPATPIRVGSLVKTSKGHFLLAISFGNLVVNNTSCFVLSPVSPLGQALLGKNPGEDVRVKNEPVRIDEVC